MEDLATLSTFTDPERQIVRTMIERGINTPRTSSVGRLFDAVASIAGVRQHVRYEGQAAMELEFALEGVALEDYYPTELSAAPPQPADHGACVPVAGPAASPAWVIDWAPLVRALVSDVRRGCPLGAISARFHNGLVEATVEVARRAAFERVILSGGCFQNRYLLERMIGRLRAAGFRPAWHQRVPPNDGGIALGQVVAVAWGIQIED